MFRLFQIKVQFWSKELKGTETVARKASLWLLAILKVILFEKALLES